MVNFVNHHRPPGGVRPMRHPVLHPGQCRQPRIPTTATAQNVEGRVGKLESEMRAVQRKVFPARRRHVDARNRRAAGDELRSAARPRRARSPTCRAASPTLEQQLSTMTNQIEQAGYNQRRLQDQFEAYRRTTDARIAAFGTAPVTADAPVDATDTTRAHRRPRSRLQTRSEIDAGGTEGHERRRASKSHRPAMRQRTSTPMASGCGTRRNTPRQRRS